jgi:hypothetical protein
MKQSAATAMIVHPEVALQVVDDVILLLARRPITSAFLDDLDVAFREADPLNSGRMALLGVYRMERLRPGDFGDTEVRNRLARGLGAIKLKGSISVLDRPGLATATLRMAMTAVLALVKNAQKMQVHDTVDHGLDAIQCAPATRERVHRTLEQMTVALAEAAKAETFARR